MNRLMRNQRGGEGKYRVWNNRKSAWVKDDGVGEENEHFVIMLKDKHARAALMAYAGSAAACDETEYARDIMELADRAGPLHANCKAPD